MLYPWRVAFSCLRVFRHFLVCSVSVSVPRGHLSWRGCDLCWLRQFLGLWAGRDNFSWSWSCYLCAFRDLCWLWQFLGLCACSHCPCIPVRMSVRGFIPCFDLAPACLGGDLSGSEVPRFFGSGASHQRSLYGQPVHAPLLVSNWILTSQSSHRAYLDSITLDLLYCALLAPRDCSGHLFIEQEAIKSKKRRRRSAQSCKK